MASMRNRYEEGPNRLARAHCSSHTLGTGQATRNAPNPPRPQAGSPFVKTPQKGPNRWSAIGRPKAYPRRFTELKMPQEQVKPPTARPTRPDRKRGRRLIEFDQTSFVYGGCDCGACTPRVGFRCRDIPQKKFTPTAPTIRHVYTSIYTHSCFWVMLRQCARLFI